MVCSTHPRPPQLPFPIFHALIGRHAATRRTSFWGRGCQGFSTTCGATIPRIRPMRHEHRPGVGRIGQTSSDPFAWRPARRGKTRPWETRGGAQGIGATHPPLTIPGHPGGPGAGSRPQPRAHRVPPRWDAGRLGPSALPGPRWPAEAGGRGWPPGPPPVHGQPEKVRGARLARALIFLGQLGTMNHCQRRAQWPMSLRNRA